MELNIKLGSKEDLAWGQEMVLAHHYLHQKVDNRARPMIYVISACSKRLGLVMAGLPHATKNGGWWGYLGLPTQWQVIDLNRIWIDPTIQAGGELARPGIVPGFRDRKGVFRPAVASWAIGEVLKRIQKDRVSLWPPVFIEQPYHIRLVISYHDPVYHKGTIYRVTRARPMYRDKEGQPCPGPSGKYGWCWELPEPKWGWSDIEILRPRNLRMSFAV